MNMTLLVLSDSHSSLSFMRLCIDTIKPAVVIHLGDHYDDGLAMAEEYPHIRIYQVPGNCDKYRMNRIVAETLVERLCGEGWTGGACSGCQKHRRSGGAVWSYPRGSL